MTAGGLVPLMSLPFFFFLRDGSSGMEVETSLYKIECGN